MTKIASEKSEIVSERVRHMNAITEAQFCVHRIGGHPKVKSKVGIALVFTKVTEWCLINGAKALSYNRIRDIWYAEKRMKISSDELEILRTVSCDNSEYAANVHLGRTVDRFEFLVNRLAQNNKNLGGKVIILRGGSNGDGRHSDDEGGGDNSPVDRGPEP
jgi:hypothetical protein